MAHRWPLAAAAIKSGGLLIIATTLAYTGNTLDCVNPNGTGPGPYHGLTRFLLLQIAILVIVAVVIMGRGVGSWMGERRSRDAALARRGTRAYPG